MTAAPQAVTPREALGLAAAYAAPRTPVETALAEIWAAALGIDRIGIRDDFFKAGGDSVKAAAAIALIEQRLGQKLPLAILLRRATVAALAGAIKEDGAAAPPDILVPIRPEGTQPPLFLIHGGAGMIHLWPAWLDAIGADQPVYGIEARGIRGEARPHDRIEAMAEDYLGVIRRVHPRGRFFLAGICIGGMVAFEMAQRLLADGEPPLALLLVDPLAQALRPEGSMEDLRRSTAGEAFITEVRERVAALQAKRGAFRDASGDAPLRALIAVQDGINAAASAYVLKPYPHFFHFFCSAPHQQMLMANARGWNTAAAGKARLWPIGPDHHSLFAEHSVRLARAMRQAMDAALRPAVAEVPA